MSVWDWLDPAHWHRHALAGAPVEPGSLKFIPADADLSAHLTSQPAPAVPANRSDMSFLAKWIKRFEQMYGQAPKWIHATQIIVSFAAPVAMEVLAINSPDTAAVAAPIISEVQADLATVSVLANDGTATPSLGSALGRIQDNLTALLTVGHIKDQKTIANVTLVVGELKALSGLLPIAAQVPPATA